MMGRGGGGNWQAKTHPALPHYPESQRGLWRETLVGCLTGCCLLEDDNLPSLFVVVVVVRTLSFISAVGSLSHPRLSSSPDRARMARKANPAINFHSRPGEASDGREREKKGRPLPVPSFLPYFPTSSFPTLPTWRRGGRPKKRQEGRRDFSRVAAAIAALNYKYLAA